jgi:hypothetical protein
MADGSLQNETFEPTLDQEQPKRKRRKQRALGLKIAATVVLALGVGTIAFVAVGFQQGWLSDAWNGLTDPQSAVIGAALTIYAAALAAVVGPLIFTGQITSLRDAGDETLREIGGHVQQLTEKLEYVRKLVRQADDLKNDNALNDDKALLTLEGIRQDAAALAVEALELSRCRKTTKDKFVGRWPGRRKYTEMLHFYRMITDAEKRSFDVIDATRQHTRESVTPDVLQKTQEALQWLRASIDARRSTSVGAGK